MKSIYIHIPFCESICTYCDFPKMFAYEKFIKPYLEELQKEILDKYEDEVVSTLYIGGGTPSCLKNENLDRLEEILKIFKLGQDYEFTFECNLNDINEFLLEKLKNMGVNRLSIGIQSFNSDKLSFMGRSSNYDNAKNVIDLARNKGFNNINLDLMYAVPNEYRRDLKEDLEKFIKLKPDHISTYSLILEDNTMISDKYNPIDEDEDLEMYKLIIKMLERKGYKHYEISNFSLKGKESRHNLNYWENEEYFGFGLGAHGYIHGIRYENTKSLNKYLEGKYLSKENVLSKQEEMENELMLGLRKIDGISLKEFFKKYKVNMQDVFPIKPLVSLGDLVFKDGCIKIPKDKLYIMNEILLKLF